MQASPDHRERRDSGLSHPPLQGIAELFAKAVALQTQQQQQQPSNWAGQVRRYPCVCIGQPLCSQSLNAVGNACGLSVHNCPSVACGSLLQSAVSDWGCSMLQNLEGSQVHSPAPPVCLQAMNLRPHSVRRISCLGSPLKKEGTLEERLQVRSTINSRDMEAVGLNGSTPGGWKMPA